MMNQLIQECEAFVKEELRHDASGHDWHHIQRVRSLSVQIAKNEQSGDLYLIELASLLHDIPDEKLNGSEEAGYEKLKGWFREKKVPQDLAGQLEGIIRAIPFKGGNNTGILSQEAKIVQDADRLDAIGAIGIARTFAYGGKKGQPLYDPELSIRADMTLEEYRSGKSSSLHHFYEKLLKLKDLLHTETARNLAIERQIFMEAFLKQFYKEWNV
ncbi:HD domain-containing protein [Peribacillus deserti]|uniref:Phosphohydrolase n=1 Tax=Peribacillus deserti TaxID=673318 RepID=A0A2N5M222_9BACI|nr:HD domain-containing protein [Peribacillus deserti]PLT28409.1 phosphohydrolase [Peribacillus deserti]